MTQSVEVAVKGLAESNRIDRAEIYLSKLRRLRRNLRHKTDKVGNLNNLNEKGFSRVVRSARGRLRNFTCN